MDRFVGRKKELSMLEHLYSSGRFETCAIFGRRQIGKTTLMTRFAVGKRAIRFQFSKGSAYENLSHFGIVVGTFLGTGHMQFGSLSEAMDSLEGICREEKTLVIFDELPFLVSSIPDTLSVLQRFIDALRDTSTMVLICGSSTSMMKGETEDYGSPLYGRFPNRIELGPLSLRECREFHPRMSDADLLRTYLTVGGVPKYHRMMDRDTYEECIMKCFLGQNAPLAEEAHVVVEGELNPSDIHSGILTCIADGKRLQNEICDAMSISKSLCSRYIRNLQEVGMVDVLHPMLNARKRPWIITDNLLSFHYSVLRGYEPLLRNDDVARTYGIMRNDISTFLGRTFELLCRDYIVSSYMTGEVGSWWGRSGDEMTDIDVVAEVYNKDDILLTVLGECKFRKDPAGVSVITSLRRKADSAKADTNVRYAVFSLGGFTEELEEYASDTGVWLIGPDKLLGDVQPDDI